MAKAIEAIHIKRPFVLKFSNTMGRFANCIGIYRLSLNERILLGDARKKTGLDDFGDERFRVGLRELLASLEAEANLNQTGRLVAYKMIANRLTGRLKLIDHRNKHPEIANHTINKPLVILGLPRTGTTILYSLLAQDPACRSPLNWEVSQPWPPPEADTYKTDARIQAAEKNAQMFRKLIPGIDAMHLFGAELPEECTRIMAFDFHSDYFGVFFNIPSYGKWLTSQDLRPTYHFHKQFLQHLQSRNSGDYWILKAPVHLRAIDVLLAVYPDARIVQTHRDPLKVVPSICSLAYATRSLCSDEIDPNELGIEWVEHCLEMLERGMAARDKLSEHTNQFYDVQFNDLMNDPFHCIKQIYSHFGMVLTSETEKRMRCFLNDNQRDKHGYHGYSLEMFGLDKRLDEVRSKFEAYRRRFNIPDSG